MIYSTQKVCAKSIEFDIIDGKVKSVKFNGGCQGNQTGISKLVEDMKIEDVINKLSGITCGNKGTSCPDQLAQALKEASK
ncbi:MAG: TIGR03905 family TSCPD domain-containing protein [Alphaproteobacteria bacterium]